MYTTTRQSNLNTMLSFPDSTTFSTCRLAAVHETASTIESDAAIKPIVSMCVPLIKAPRHWKAPLCPTKQHHRKIQLAYLTTHGRPLSKCTLERTDTLEKRHHITTKTVVLSASVHCKLIFLLARSENKLSGSFTNNLGQVDRRNCWADLKQCLQGIYAFLLVLRAHSILNRAKIKYKKRPPKEGHDFAVSVGHDDDWKKKKLRRTIPAEPKSKNKPTQWAGKKLCASKIRNNTDSRATLWMKNEMPNKLGTHPSRSHYLQCTINASVTEPTLPWFDSGNAERWNILQTAPKN